MICSPCVVLALPLTDGNLETKPKRRGHHETLSLFPYQLQKRTAFFIHHVPWQGCADEPNLRLRTHAPLLTGPGSPPSSSSPKLLSLSSDCLPTHISPSNAESHSAGRRRRSLAGSGCKPQHITVVELASPGPFFVNVEYHFAARGNSADVGPAILSIYSIRACSGEEEKELEAGEFLCSLSRQSVDSSRLVLVFSIALRTTYMYLPF
ncbi:hypothetical protein IWZ01DRAFT_360054 [Phyllosticta capitalensis]